MAIVTLSSEELPPGSKPLAERNFGMDLARCVAILLVLIDHITTYVYRPAHHADRYFWPLGFLGVELFFVLSGYLIGQIFFGITARVERITFPTIKYFWVRRWLRTAPLYFLFLGLHFLSPNSHLNLGYLVFAQNLTGPDNGSFPISWSLAVEEWFYFVLPLLSLVMYRLTKRPIRAIFIAVTTIFVFSALAKFDFATGLIWEKEVRRVVVYRLDSLMFGVLLAGIFLYRPAWFHRLGQNWIAGLNLLNLAALYVVTSRLYGGSLNFRATGANLLLFPWADVSFALMLAWLWHWKAQRGPVQGFVVTTSLLAYSLYLAHLPVMRALQKTRLGAGGSDEMSRWLSVLVVAVASYAVAALTYRLVEKPFMDLRQKLRSLEAPTLVVETSKQTVAG